jgi:hypothetical protein
MSHFDMKMAPVFAYQMYRAVPGAQFTVFENSGPLRFAEEPDRFVGRVESFLGTIPSDAVNQKAAQSSETAQCPRNGQAGTQRLQQASTTCFER